MTNSYYVLVYDIRDPTTLVASSILGLGEVAGLTDLITGGSEPERHCVLVIPHPGQPGREHVMDMTRMQYGVKGRGDYGEHYFLGTRERWTESMSSICSPERSGIGSRGNTDTLQEPARAKACAQKVLERWNNRAVKGWCDFCGKPDGKDPMIRCSRCERVKYCCKIHKRADWRLHTHTCEKNVVDEKSAAMGI
jgi:hypothetical protein